jgi:hypothetical protein
MHFEVESARFLIVIKTILSKKLPVAERHSNLRKNLLNEAFEKNTFGSIVFNMSLVITPI